jgi:hypothetical protein
MPVAKSTRQWTKQRILDLVVRLRWELMNNTMSAADIIAEAKLDNRLQNSETRSSNFSRWLRHTEEVNYAFLLTDDELDNIQLWLSKKEIPKPEFLLRLFPKHMSFFLQHWLTPGNDADIKFENQYAVYRCSSSILDRVVIGRLYVTCKDGLISTIEEYDLTDFGPKSGRYESEGGFVQSSEKDIYLLSRFSNGDLQTAVFTNANVQKSGYGENKVIRMSGVVMSTMTRRPYSARIHCEADPSGNTKLRTSKIDEVPEEVQETLKYSIHTSELNVIRF